MKGLILPQELKTETNLSPRWSSKLSILLLISTMLGKVYMFPEPCTGIPMVDLLEYAVPSPQHLPVGVSIVYDRQSHVHAYQFSPNAQRIYLNANIVLQSCLYFPYEFSYFITYKKHSKSQKEQCLLSLVQLNSQARLMSIGLYKDRIIFRYKQRKFSFKMAPGYQDRKWHTLGISMASTELAITWDCHFKREKFLKFVFPDLLSVVNSSFLIGRCPMQSSLFQGLVKSVLFLPGRDATSLACSARVSPHVLYPITVDNKAVYSNIYSDGVGDDFCRWSDVGNIAYDVNSALLKVCVNGLWKDIQQKEKRARIDYLVSYQIIGDGQSSLDVEIFTIPGEGKFAVFALSDFQGSIVNRSSIYKWSKGKFKFYQSLPTFSAQSFEYFVINEQYFLAVANFGVSNSNPTNSTIFQWNRTSQLFEVYQNILTYTARDIEAFKIDANYYLAVANHAKGDDTNINSLIYKWSRKRKMFVHHQDVPTIGAYDWTYFNVDGYHFLVVANAFTGLTTLVFSVIYIWQNEKWIQFQTLETNGATDWEYFTLNKEHFLVVANAYNYGSQNFRNVDSYRTNSTIFKLNRKKRVFTKYQDITTNSAIDWEYLTVGGDHFLMVSNAQNGGTNERLTTTMYRWQGLDQFVSVHSMYTQPNADIEYFKDNTDIFILLANIKGSVGEVLKVKFV